MRLLPSALLTGAALLTACAPTPGDLAHQRALAEATPVGAPLDCLPLRTIRSTRVLSDRVIDFHGPGRRVYRNTLPQSCPGLGFEERFSYRTSIDRLCSVDTITVLGPTGARAGATCGLGRFQEIRLAPRRG
jgi:hypothetical protein